MRILTSICCTAILLPLTSLAATALEDPMVKNTEFFSISRKADLLFQQQWITEAAKLKTIIAQVEDPSPIKEANLADNSWSESDSIDTEKAQDVIFQLQNLESTNFSPNRGAPGMTIGNPYGFGADGGAFFAGFGYQSDTRFGNDDDEDGVANFGVGLGNAKKAVGLELSYTMGSFGNNRDFGTGGFNAKMHRQFPGAWGVAAGWNGFLNLGDENDFENSFYLVTSKIFRTREKLNSPFSRIAATVGFSNSEFNNDSDREFDVLGSLAFRVARPLSTVVEWTGSDLAMGVSASPFRRVPLTLNIAVRDIAGEGDGARLVFGAGMGF
ncbi:hypothetical protein Xen7305DRAFT_00015560 [Xenococcus sp. PCC 7305]|uniref:hypothetical protein n=1 Tax=Xenococcus sp. PCC 7305 TaxID=102125 RepID=UPI0002ABBEF3|nr:hypothetical protein [Xenococcus sp. PCC 7305]ELS01849.1 hypothetical protein Xen7305DRAFT_00015560 [Xenococcus sp. PCC 7305]